MSSIIPTLVLLILSNCLMLSAWYLQLKYLDHKAWYIAVIASWGVAFFEYAFHIPAIRMGNAALPLHQLHLLQVGLSLLVFMPFSMLVMNRPFNTDYYWAALCLLGSTYFIFRR